MNEPKKRNKGLRLPVTLAVIPAVLTVLEIAGILITNSGGAAKNVPGLYFIGVTSVLGLFALPFFCLFFEVIGLIVSVRRKKKALIIITAAEIVITVLAAVCSVLFLVFAVNA